MMLYILRGPYSGVSRNFDRARKFRILIFNKYFLYPVQKLFIFNIIPYNKSDLSPQGIFFNWFV